MADFCSNCNEELGFPEADYNLLEIVKKLTPGYGVSGMLCEHCGLVGVMMTNDSKIYGVYQSSDPKVHKTKLLKIKNDSPKETEDENRRNQAVGNG